LSIFERLLHFADAPTISELHLDCGRLLKLVNRYVE
jgi:hypothetical protein